MVVYVLIYYGEVVEGIRERERAFRREERASRERERDRASRRRGIGLG